jgi:ABC-2 type transport system permease protein
MILRFKRYFGDTAVMSGRILRHTFRSMDTLISVIFMPVLIMLMFVYVLGGAMKPGSTDYVNYVVPGVLMFTILSVVAYTAFRINNDVSGGMFDRFHSMPVSKSAILGGHVLTSVIFSVVSTIMVLLVAFLIGFRPTAGILQWLGAIALMLLFSLSLTWVSVTSGLLANSAEGASAFAYPMLGLLFISSAFAPTDSMPGVVKAFAEYQPMTPIIEAVRSLLLNEPAGDSAWVAVLWCVGIWIVFYAAAMRAYKRKRA